MEYNRKNNKKYQIYKCLVVIGVFFSLVCVIIPADKGNIIDGENIRNLFEALTQGETARMLYGHEENPMHVPAQLVSSVILYFPALCLLNTVVFILWIPHHKLGFITGLIGTVVFIVSAFLMILNGTICIGIYINLGGSIITLLGLLLFYIDDEDVDEFDEGNNISIDSENAPERFTPFGKIHCIGGELAGAQFHIKDSVIIGKNAQQCNIILSNSTISKKHCIIRVIPDLNMYSVEDCSKNGTHYFDGTLFVKNKVTTVPRGTIIYMGKPKEEFLLS